MSYFRDSLTPKMNAATAFVVANAIAPTTVVVSAESTSATSTTDVVYTDADLSTYCGVDWHPDSNGDGAYIIGFTKCVSLFGARCERFDVLFDTSRTDQASFSTSMAQGLACHESGHTLGLSHRDNGSAPDVGCMPANVPPYWSYSPHDLNHINTFF